MLRKNVGIHQPLNRVQHGLMHPDVLSETPVLLSQQSHRENVESVATPLTARLSSIPVPLLRQGIADVVKEMGEKAWPENRGKMPGLKYPMGQ